MLRTLIAALALIPGLAFAAAGDTTTNSRTLTPQVETAEGSRVQAWTLLIADEATAATTTVQQRQAITIVAEGRHFENICATPQVWSDTNACFLETQSGGAQIDNTEALGGAVDVDALLANFGEGEALHFQVLLGGATLSTGTGNFGQIIDGDFVAGPGPVAVAEGTLGYLTKNALGQPIVSYRSAGEGSLFESDQTLSANRDHDVTNNRIQFSGPGNNRTRLDGFGLDGIYEDGGDRSRFAFGPDGILFGFDGFSNLSLLNGDPATNQAIGGMDGFVPTAQGSNFGLFWEPNGPAFAQTAQDFTVSEPACGFGEISNVHFSTTAGAGASTGRTYDANTLYVCQTRPEIGFADNDTLEPIPRREGSMYSLGGVLNVWNGSNWQVLGDTGRWASAASGGVTETATAVLANPNEVQFPTTFTPTEDGDYVLRYFADQISGGGSAHIRVGLSAGTAETLPLTPLGERLTPALLDRNYVLRDLVAGTTYHVTAAPGGGTTITNPGFEIRPVAQEPLNVAAAGTTPLILPIQGAVNADTLLAGRSTNEPIHFHATGAATVSSASNFIATVDGTAGASAAGPLAVPQGAQGTLSLGLLGDVQVTYQTVGVSGGWTFQDFTNGGTYSGGIGDRVLRITTTAAGQTFTIDSTVLSPGDRIIAYNNEPSTQPLTLDLPGANQFVDAAGQFATLTLAVGESVTMVRNAGAFMTVTNRYPDPNAGSPSLFIQQGTVASAGGAGAGTDVYTVTFPTAFAGTPVVTAVGENTFGNGQGVEVTIQNVTPTTFQWFAHRNDGIPFSNFAAIQWRASDGSLTAGGGGLPTVATDATLNGDGTAGSPLSVADPDTSLVNDSITANAANQTLTQSFSDGSQTWNNLAGWTIDQEISAFPGAYGSFSLDSGSVDFDVIGAPGVAANYSLDAGQTVMSILAGTEIRGFQLGTTNRLSFDTTTGADLDSAFEQGAGYIDLQLGAASELRLNGTPGTAGQVATSAGPGLPPTWTTVSGGGGGLASVTSDATLTGDGTAGSPLSVVNSHQAVTTTGFAGLTVDANQVVDLDASTLATAAALATTNAAVALNTAKVSADGSINTHSDVDTSTAAPTVGQVLEWDGSNWIPATVSGGGASDAVVGRLSETSLNWTPQIAAAQTGLMPNEVTAGGGNVEMNTNLAGSNVDFTGVGGLAPGVNIKNIGFTIPTPLSANRGAIANFTATDVTCQIELIVSNESNPGRTIWAQWVRDALGTPEILATGARHMDAINRRYPLTFSWTGDVTAGDEFFIRFETRLSQTIDTWQQSVTCTK